MIDYRDVDIEFLIKKIDSKLNNFKKNKNIKEENKLQYNMLKEYFIVNRDKLTQKCLNTIGYKMKLIDCTF